METQTETITPETLSLFHEPPGTLRLTIGEDRSYPIVRLYQAAPLSRPGHYLSLLDSKGEEIVMVEALTDLPTASQPVAEEELRRRYLTAQVEAILELRTEFGVTYWHVKTDKGERDFVVQSLSESCVWLSDRHILLIDADGSRFEIPDREALDIASRERLAAVL